MTLELQILTFSGRCQPISAPAQWTVKDLKDEIVQSGLTEVLPIQLPIQQRLLLGEHVLKDADKLGDALPAGQSCHDIFRVLCHDPVKMDLITRVSRPSSSWLELRNAPQQYRDDDDVVLAAVKANSFSITLASQRLQTGIEFVAQAIKLNVFVADHLPQEVVRRVRSRGQQKATEDALEHVEVLTSFYGSMPDDNPPSDEQLKKPLNCSHCESHTDSNKTQQKRRLNGTKQCSCWRGLLGLLKQM